MQTFVHSVLSLLDRVPISLAVLAALTLGLAPFFPQPHLTEKIAMLMSGTLTEPIDILDLLIHAAPFALLGAKLARIAFKG